MTTGRRANGRFRLALLFQPAVTSWFGRTDNLAQSSADSLHTNFRLRRRPVPWHCSRPQSGGLVIADYLNYSLPTADHLTA